MRKLNKKGFTIIELVIVIAVIAILAAVMVPTFSSVVDKANQSKALQEVKNAYTLTLAEDLSTPETGDDIVNDKGNVIVKYNENITIIISENGKAEVYTGNDAATHKLNGEKLELAE